MAFLAKKLDGKSFIEQIKFVWNEWIDGWESLKFDGWKRGFRKLLQSPSFYVRSFLWIVR